MSISYAFSLSFSLSLLYPYLFLFLYFSHFIFHLFWNYRHYAEQQNSRTVNNKTAEQQSRARCNTQHFYLSRFVLMRREYSFRFCYEKRWVLHCCVLCVVMCYYVLCVFVLCRYRIERTKQDKDENMTLGLFRILCEQWKFIIYIIDQNIQ